MTQDHILIGLLCLVIEHTFTVKAKNFIISRKKSGKGVSFVKPHASFISECIPGSFGFRCGFANGIHVQGLI